MCVFWGERESACQQARAAGAAAAAGTRARVSLASPLRVVGLQQVEVGVPLVADHLAIGVLDWRTVRGTVREWRWEAARASLPSSRLRFCRSLSLSAHLAAGEAPDRDDHVCCLGLAVAHSEPLSAKKFSAMPPTCRGLHFPFARVRCSGGSCQNSLKSALPRCARAPGALLEVHTALSKCGGGMVGAALL